MIVDFIKVSRFSDTKLKQFSINEASFSLNPQQHLAVLGKNEAGTSDLIKLLSGSIQPTSGKILRYDASSAHLGDASTFHRELTGEENIRFMCKLYGATAKHIIPEVASLTGLGKVLKKRVKSYAPPQRRKIALALPLFLDVKMYIIDDGFGGIGHPDAQFSERYSQLVKQKSQEKTLIIRSNNLPLLKSYTIAAVIVKDGGKVIFKDTLEKGLEESNDINN